MKPTLHIVTQCTDRKKLPVGREHRLRAIKGRELETRAREWKAALEQSEHRVPLRELYAGEHWVASLGLERQAAALGFSTRLWVVSAGLGFVSADERAPGYSATFSPGSPDSVLTGGADSAMERQQWLHFLRGKRSPRLGDLVADDSGARVLCILSKPYLQALQAELQATRESLSNPEHLLLVTSDAPAGELERNWVPSSARLKERIGGTRVGQHARLAGALMQELGHQLPTARNWRDTTHAWLESAPEQERYDRSPLSDGEVRAFLRHCRAGSWSRALRDLRASGKACEQKRFRQLFKEVHAP